MTNLSKIDQLFVSGLEAHIETMKATPGEDCVTRQLHAQALLQSFKTLGATLILRVTYDALAASTGEQEQAIGFDSSVDWHLNQLVTSLGRAKTITSNLSRRTASELQMVRARYEENVTMSQGLAIRLKDVVDSNLRQRSDCISDNPRFDYCCNFCGVYSSEPHTITHKPDCEGLALQRELREVLGG